jgi:hypothetical protein
MLNFEGEGSQLAEVGKRRLYVSPNEKDVEDGKKTIKLKGEMKFQQIPNVSQERDVLYITAPSGSGKSYYCREYIKVYHRMYPKRDIYIISSLEKDETLDALKYLKRIKIKSEQFLETELDCEDFKNSLVVFDDVDVLSNKIIKKKVMLLLNNLLETGRHTYTSVIYTTHIANAGLETKRILSECHSLTVFPLTMGNNSLKYLLESTFGFDKKEIQQVKNITGRWITIFKTYPTVLMTENECWIKGNR